MKKFIVSLFITLGFITNLLAENEIMPKFNSLAEEAAYKKQQVKAQPLEISNEEFQKKREEYNNNNAKFYEKYAVEKLESLESIDEKYKNREKLFSELEKDNKLLQMEFDAVINMEHKKYPSFTYDYPFIQKFQIERDDAFEKIKKTYEYDSEWFVGPDRKRLNLDFVTGTFDLKYYEQYLRNAYETYSLRQDEYIKKNELYAKQKIESEKRKKEKLERIKNIKEERIRVQDDCQKWLEKAHKEVYSLGVGERITIIKDGKTQGSYPIKAVEENTFLIGLFNQTLYVQKADYIPYGALEKAPSPYCYQ